MRICENAYRRLTPEKKIELPNNFNNVCCFLTVRIMKSIIAIKRNETS